MPQDSNHDNRNNLSATDMQNWLQHEISDVQKAADLRIKDATKLVRQYVAGEISPQEVEDLIYAYSERWGDALPGVLSSRGMSDEAILQTIDQSRHPNFAERLRRATNRERSG